jgi:hypothetical protein
MTVLESQKDHSGTVGTTVVGQLPHKYEKGETQKIYTRLSYNSTSAINSTENPQRIYREVLASFRDAQDEVFEFGMESTFLDKLCRQVRHYGSIAIEAMASIILSNKAKPHVIAEALRWLGDVNHRDSHSLRLRLLEEALRNESRWIRDGALLGLDAMGDKHAIAHLNFAAEVESIAELRKDMKDVITRLVNMS